MTSPARNYTTLEAGDPAPRFALPSTAGTVSLDAVFGRQHTVLVFFAHGFIGRDLLRARLSSSATTLSALASESTRFAAAGARLLGISRDSVERHTALAARLAIPFPLLADETGDVGEMYGLLPANRWAGSSHSYDFTCRLVIVDRGGFVRHGFDPDVVVSPDHPAQPEVQASHREHLRLWLGTPASLSTSAVLAAVRAL
jgi:peroxiredoxin Q/BCP